MSRPNIIAITMGDPAGIGPEIIIKALNDDTIKELKGKVRLLIIGNKDIFKKTAQRLDVDFQPQEINEVAIKERLPESTCCLLSLGHDDFEANQTKLPHPVNGQASLDYINKAIGLVTHHKVDAIVTAPVSKAAINQAGYSFTGHTEFLAQRSKARKSVMMFVLNSLRVALVTTHLAYKKVPLHLNVENILSTVSSVDKALKQYFGFFEPRIGVCALNPHAGEDGLFGREEKTMIKPAIELARQQKMIALGPFPADGIFRMSLMGELDAIVALYHDQAMIPMKTLGYEAREDRILSFNPAVNVTLGLPFIRTSVAHGTGFDIAGQNRAHPDSMINAIKLAYQMSLNQPDLFEDNV